MARTPQQTARRRAWSPGHALPALAVLAVVVVVAGCTGNAGLGEVDYYSPGHWHSVGDVSATTLHGGKLSLDSMRGHVVVVNFWGSWCAPCRAEQRTLNEVRGSAAARDVDFVGIDVRDSRANALAFLRTHPAAYPSLFDPDDMLGLRFPGAEPATTPTTIVLTPQGQIAARVSGGLLYTQLVAVIDHVKSETA